MDAAVQCRKAVPGDAPGVVALCKELEYHEGDDRSRASAHGFLIYVKPEEAYAERFLLSRYCFVAECGGEIIGSLVAHDRGEIEALGESLQYPRVLLTYLLSLDHPHWIYIDQLGIHPDHQHHGVGQMLYDCAFGDMKSDLLIAGVTHAPVPNDASRQFFEKNHHALLTELQEGEWLCGMYGRDIGNRE